MTKSYRAAIAVSYMALLVSGQAAAQTLDRQAPPNQVLVGRIQAGATLGRYLQSLRVEILRLDANGDGAIDSADVDIHNTIAAAGYRANASMRFMNADLDGDGAVTEAELRLKLEYDGRMMAANQNIASGSRVPSPDERIAQEIRNLMAADADNDGRITWSEVIEFIKKQPGYAQSVNSGLVTSLRQLLPLASDGKTSVSLAEIEAAATAAFMAVDTDGNGTISQDELDAARSQVNHQRSVEQTRLNCGMPAASERSKIVLLSSSETEALSNVAIGTQDEITGVGIINVEPGDEPIYLVIASYQPTIWRFSGAVERIERVVVTTTRTGLNRTDPNALPPAGVTGLPADRITFARQSGCVSVFNEAPSIDAAKAAGVVKQQAGKDVAVTAGRFRVAGFRVPSGKVDVVESNRPGLLVFEKNRAQRVEGQAGSIQPQAETGNLERIFLHWTPGGLIEIDAKSVVASSTVEPYEVAPQEAGLIQLMKSGALTQNQRGEFLIHSKIRYPAALSGRHTAKFLLMRGVPLPEGDPGNSLVIAEETGEPIDKRR
jgi:Ca2+-binding EF-hand superfamily protein